MRKPTTRPAARRHLSTVRGKYDKLTARIVRMKPDNITANLRRKHDSLWAQFVQAEVWYYGF